MNGDQGAIPWFGSEVLPLDAGDDPYFRADYHQAYHHDGASSWLYRYRDSSGGLWYPVRLHPIRAVGAEPVDEELFDLETVYGYTGPWATTDDPDFLRRAWDGFGSWVKERQVVSEFCRFHPLLGTHRFRAPGMTVIRDRDTVAIPLTGGEAALWAGYDSVLRNRLRKAATHGLVCRRLTLAEGLPLFRILYETTMTALKAGSFYFFPDSYYRDLAALEERLAVFAVFKEDIPVAAALFLVGERVIHYHLGGSLSDYRVMAPNNLLFHSVASWGMARGAHFLFLGGGRSNRDDDELLRFKRHFSKNTVPFFFGKRIWRPDLYARLSESWRRQAGTFPPMILQHYRLPLCL
jgi:hypothetical protein